MCPCGSQQSGKRDVGRRGWGVRRSCRDGVLALSRLLLLLALSLGAGCAPVWFLRGGVGARDPLEGYAGVPGYAVLTNAAARAVVDSRADATLLFSVEMEAQPWMAESPGWRGGIAPADRSADRLLIGLSGAAGLFPEERQVLETAADRHRVQRAVRLESVPQALVYGLSIDREIRLLPAGSLATWVPVPLPAELEITAYESRTSFTNPGPLPWPADLGLPYIRVETDLQRQADLVWILHRDPGHALVEVPGVRQVVRERAILGILEDAAERRLVLPADGLLPRIALLDRQQGLLTLIAYTPPLGLGTGRNHAALQPPPELVFGPVTGGRRWIRVVTAGPALPLATGGRTRHHRQTFHVRGGPADLLQVAAAFCRLPVEGVAALLATSDEVTE